MFTKLFDFDSLVQKSNIEKKRHCMYYVHMNEIRFTWDTRKAERNLKAHGVSFDEAKSVFYDELAILIDDPDHSEDEDRFLILGLSLSLRLLIVSHCYRKSGDEIRLISARKATRKESKNYPRGAR